MKRLYGLTKIKYNNETFGIFTFLKEPYTENILNLQQI